MAARRWALSTPCATSRMSPAKEGPSLCSAFRASLLVLLLLTPPTTAEAGELRVCADPNNLPFSNDKGEGFENKIAELIGKKLGMSIRYSWIRPSRTLSNSLPD